MLHDHNWQQTQEQLTRQVSRLAREVSAMSRTMHRMGAEIGDEAGAATADLIGATLHQGEVIAHDLGRRAKRVGKAVRKDPMPAVVTVVGLALLLSLLFGRKR